MKTNKNEQKKASGIRSTWTSFDDNGHRVVRNQETTHRLGGPKVKQNNPKKFHISVIIDLETAAKARQYVKGKEVDARATEKRKVRKPTRKLTISALVEEYLVQLTKGVVLDAEETAWLEATRKRNAELRERNDAMVAAGINRIPKDQQLTRGVGSESYRRRMAKAK